MVVASNTKARSIIKTGMFLGMGDFKGAQAPLGEGGDQDPVGGLGVGGGFPLLLF